MVLIKKNKILFDKNRFKIILLKLSIKLIYIINKS